MTTRTEANPPTPIERATIDVVRSIDAHARLAYKEENVLSQRGTTEQEFRRILALYFHDKSLADWCHDLGIPNPEERQ